MLFKLIKDKHVLFLYFCGEKGWNSQNDVLTLARSSQTDKLKQFCTISQPILYFASKLVLFTYIKKC